MINKRASRLPKIVCPNCNTSYSLWLYYKKERCLRINDTCEYMDINEVHPQCANVKYWLPHRIHCGECNNDYDDSTEEGHTLMELIRKKTIECHELKWIGCEENMKPGMKKVGNYVVFGSPQL